MRDIEAELKQLHAVNPNVGVVYNGKTALEWYTLYCQASGELEKIKKFERDRWTGFAMVPEPVEILTSWDKANDERRMERVQQIPPSGTP